MQLQRTVHAVIRPGEQSGYVAECPALHAVTQGSTLDEIAANLREVLALALEGEDLEQLGLAPSPVLIATLELEPEVA
ncbi:MAG: type II toxin-antitoxin system HicB family antitoxin [Chloroflexota bacterium]|nr:type II toxin-antitoxin system HicB family antitoxin [Chloroflexota bacterium]